MDIDNAENKKNTDLNAISVNNPPPPFRMKASQNKRFLNFMIDYYIQTILLLLFVFPAYSIFKESLFTEYRLSYYLLCIVFMIIYYVFFESAWGKTPAKFLTKTKVLTNDEKIADIKTILIRTICRFIPFDIFSFLFSTNPAGWHDKFSKTIVIDEKNNKPVEFKPLKTMGLLLMTYIGTSAVFIVILGLLIYIFLLFNRIVIN